MTQSRVESFKRNVRREYKRYSIINEVFPEQQSAPIGMRFQQIGFRFLSPPGVFIESYSSKEHYSTDFVGVGHSIATGEEKYLVDVLRRRIMNKTSVEELSIDALNRALRVLKDKPSYAFIPLSFYSELHSNVSQPIHYRTGSPKPWLNLGPGSQAIAVYWSNNFVPFDDFMFLSPGFGGWFVQPDPEGNNLTIEVEPSKSSEKIEVRIRTIVSFHVQNPRAGLILRVPLRRKQP